MRSMVRLESIYLKFWFNLLRKMKRSLSLSCSSYLAVKRCLNKSVEIECSMPLKLS